MDGGIRGHRMKERDIVDAGRQMRKQVADPLPALAILMEIPARLDDSPLILMPAATECFDFDRLIVASFHRGLVVECIDVTGAAVHE